MTVRNPGFQQAWQMCQCETIAVGSAWQRKRQNAVVPKCQFDMWGEAGAGADRWSRRFSVGPTGLHPRGFTLYRLTSYVFPKSSPEALTVVTVWKRFSDLHKLQRKIYRTHKELHLIGACPSYFKWSYFKRFDPEVVEERIKNTQLLLEFIATHPPLFTSTDFVNFFQTSYPDPNIKNSKSHVGNIDEIRSSLLLPIDAFKPLEYQSSEEDSCSMTDSYSISMTDSVSVNSSMNYRDCFAQSTHQPNINDRDESNGIQNKNLSIKFLSDNKDVVQSKNSRLKSKDELSTDCDDANKSCIQNVSFKSNLPDLISFDNINLSHKSPPALDSNDNAECIRHDHETFDIKNIGVCNNNISVPQAFVPSNNASNVIQKAPSLKINDCTNSSNINQTSNEKQCEEDEVLLSETNETNNHAITGNKKFRNNDKTISSHSQLNSSTTEELTSSVDLQENYVFEAGYLLSLGAKNEGKADYQAAFDSYKFGIEKLLIGVQGDTNELRRQFVKEKVTKYLSHAEKIYSTYLNNDDEDFEKISFSKINTPVTNKISKNHHNISEYSQPYQSLSKYKVLNILSGQVMLVLCSETQQSYAMKVIQKSCNTISDDDYFNRGHLENKLPLLPVDIPYMVKLKFYIETPNLIFLVLQYASGGKLFDYIHNYAKSVPNTPAREVNLENVFVNLKDDKKTPVQTHITKFVADISVDNADNNKKKDSVFAENEQKCHDLSISVSDLVVNSQKLLSDVDNALTGKSIKNKENCCSSTEDSIMNNKTFERLNLLTFKNEIKTDTEENRYLIQSKMFKKTCALPPKSICKWSAELLTAVDNLHKFGIICRTLQPKNLLLGEGGHLLLSYIVGQDSEDIVLPFYNTPHSNLYIAPELQQYLFWSEYGQLDERVSDYWSFGAILYELIVGVPLSCVHPSGFNSHTILYFPDDVPSDAKDLLSHLLEFDPTKRLGYGSRHIEEIKSHSYFKDINWDSL